MNGNQLSKFVTLSIWLSVLGVLFTACGAARQSAEPSLSQPFPIAPEIEAYYRKVGAEEVLGAIISPRLEEGKYVYQYTVNALLFCEQGLSDDRRVRFAPIGLDLNLFPYQSLSKVEGTEYTIKGIPIYREFVPLYEKLGGGERIGAPLSGLHYNPRQKRYEQFFEGVGMYRLESDPPSKVKLLAYGAWRCGNACFYPVPRQAEVNLPLPIDARLAPLIERLGVDFTGFALSPAIKDTDGKEVVIFENVAFELQPNSEGGASLLPIPQKLGIFPQGLVTNQEDETKIFLSLDGDKGHHILRSFMSYIDMHGGLEWIGLPISEPIEWEKGNLRQCFEKVCLIEDRQIEGVYRIRPSPLGFEYASLFFASQYGTDGQPIIQSGAQPPTDALPTAIEDANPEITLEILEAKPFVDDQTQQEIGVIVRFGNQPAVNLQPTLILALPNGEVYKFDMPLTNGQGKSSFVVPPIQAPNGTLIDYRVCITTREELEVCARDDYLIWSP